MKAGSVTLTKSIDLKAFRTQFSEIYFQATLESQSGFFYDKSNSFLFNYTHKDLVFMILLTLASFGCKLKSA